MILGVYDESLVQPLAHALVSLGVKDGMVVYGQDCLDELSTACPTTVCEFHGDDYVSYVLTPEELGMKRCMKEDLQGGSPEENAQITRDILFGKEMGAKRDTVLLNAAAGLYIAGLVPSLRDGVARAQELIDSGKAAETLESYIRASNQEAEVAILDEIAAYTRQRMAEEEGLMPTASLRQQACAMASAEREANGGNSPFRFNAALAEPGLSFICEVKKASPSKGVIAEEFPYLNIAKSYEAAGAAAISCLTEPKWFMGADAYLTEIAAETSVPVLRKDFVVCERMIYQAKVLGASAVLLICAILSDDQLVAYRDLAESLGLSVLVEAHDEKEIARAVASGAKIVGVNNRNLKDFSVDFDTVRCLRAHIPEDVLYVAESGVASAEDVAAIAQLGADAALIGEALMRADDKQATLAGFRAAAEAAR